MFRVNPNYRLFFVWLVLAFLAASQEARAESFKLTTGAVIQGDLVEKSSQYIKIQVEGKGNIMTVKMKYLALETVNKLRDMDAALEVDDANETMKRRDFDKYVELGNTFLNEENFEQALVYYDRSLEIYPDDFDLNFLVARIHLSQKNIEGAIVFLERAIETRPDDMTALLTVGSAYRLNDQMEKAVETFEKAHEVAPKDFTACYELAQTYMYTGEYDKAIEFFDKAHQIEPEEPQVMLNLGNIYRLKEDYLKARENYQNAADSILELIKDMDNKPAQAFFKENEWLLTWGLDHIEYMDKQEQLLKGFWERLAFEEEEFRYATTYDKKEMSRETIGLMGELKQSFLALNAGEEFLPFQEQIFATFDVASRCREIRIADFEAQDNIDCLVEMYSSYLEALNRLTVVYKKHRLPSTYAKQMVSWKNFIRSNIKQLLRMKQQQAQQ